MFYLRRSNNIIVNNISVYFKKWMQIKNKKSCHLFIDKNEGCILKLSFLFVYFNN